MKTLNAITKNKYTWRFKNLLEPNLNKTKGFTLIELLAVVIILAVVLLIAVPTVLNLIEKTNKEAFKTSSIALAKAAENYVIKSQMFEKEVLDITLPD
ncbi:MAG: type II secretion system protein, partial [Bacilli bacterium]